MRNSAPTLSWAGRRTTLSLALLCALMLTGVSAQVQAAPPAQFNIDQANEPAGLDPHGQWNADSYYVYRNIFDNLLTRTTAGQIAPQIATAWRYLSDTEVEFTIRKDVKFHDGSALTPDDVAFSIRRIVDPAFASPQLGQFNQIVDAQVSGPDTVRVKTDAPSPVLLAQLVKLSIVPRKVVEAVGKDAFNAQPVGSGPYTFTGWQRGVAVTLTRNDSYWDTKGPFQKVVFRAVPDAATRLADLQTGTADLVTTLDTDQAAQLAGSARAKPLFVLSERVAYLQLNTSKPPLDDVRVRRAIAQAIDREGIIDGVLGGHAEATPELVTPVHVGWTEGIAIPAYDAAAATATISQLGAAARTPLEIATGPAYDPRVVQALQQMLSGIGLNVSVKSSDMASLIQSIRQGPAKAPTMNFGTWSCACQDADGVLYSLLHSSSGWATIKEPAVDQALDAARKTLDPAVRAQQYAIVHRYVADQAPIVPLYRVSLVFGANQKLVWTPTPNQSLFLNRMGWKD